MILSFLLKRPVGVLMTFFVVILFSILAFYRLPVSLLPETDAPRIVIKVLLPNGSPAEIEQNILRPIREKMLTLPYLRDMRSEANAENGLIELFFDYGAKMQYLYVEINEKIDQLTPNLPREMQRPQVLRISTADIPLIRLQITPIQKTDILRASELTEKVLKKRLEATEGVSMVDINGLKHKIIGIRFRAEQLQALQITEEQVLKTIADSNQELGAISVADGQYRYFLKFSTTLGSIEHLQKLFVMNRQQNLIPITQVAEFEETTARSQGLHLANNHSALVLTLHKQSNAQMDKLMPLITEKINILKKEYPFLKFQLSQNQYDLLEAGISNLQNDLLWGGLFAFVILFIFIGNYQIPFIIGIILPSSLVISFLVFWIMGVSINIVSLSGLALGLGMTIDNAIIIFDNISKKRLQGLSLVQSCIWGTSEMFAPLLGSGITTLAVFIPLVFIGGIAGAFTTDQAISVGAILVASLLVSCILLPLLYLIFFQKSQKMPKEDTKIYLFLLKIYKKIYTYLLLSPLLSFSLMLLVGILGLFIFLFLPIEGLPEIKRNDIVLQINWNEPISLEENEQRIKMLLNRYQKYYSFSESDIGIADFLFQREAQALSEAQVYLLLKDIDDKNKIKKNIEYFFLNNYPQAHFKIADAPNVFDLIFKSNIPYYEIKLRNNSPLFTVEYAKIQAIISKNNEGKIRLGKGGKQETYAQIVLDINKLNNYRISKELVIKKLQQVFSEREITVFRNFGNRLPVSLTENQEDFLLKIQNTVITVDSNSTYRLSDFMAVNFVTDYKTIMADKIGIFHSVEIPSSISEPQIIANKLIPEIQKNGLQADFGGEYFENRENLQKLYFILLISVVLLYLILTVEFESLRQPLVVLLTLPLGFTGSLLGILIGGASMNVMSAIGMVVMLGVIDNEAILKIDTINRLREIMPLEEAIAKAGEISFKPVLMTSLTNILALIPFLFDNGIGGDLQRPFVLSIMGGLSFGTFTSLFFVSLAYKVLVKPKKLKK
ncbi:MAG: efflux RND transporter permease subunit [Thermonemataceae bacterium]|nr:efflux RND transporter permease subunit [Thermonemataceae bacterium]